MCSVSAGDRVERGQRGDRFRAGVAAEPGAEASSRLRLRRVVCRGEGGDEVGHGLLDDRAQLVRVADVDAHRQRRAQRRGVADQAQQRVDDVGPGVRGQPDGQVDRRVAERGRGVDPAARQVEGVAGAQDPVDDGRPAAGVGDRRAVVGPHLVLERVRVHGRVDHPVLLAGHLQDEHVVGVVVRREPLRRRRRHVRVDLRGVPSSSTSSRVKSTSGGHIRCRPWSTIVAPAANSASTLSLDTWSDTSAPNPPDDGVPGGREHVALVRQPDERRAQGASADELVDRGRGEQVGEVVVRRGEQGGAAPELVGELLGGDADAAGERGPQDRSALSFLPPRTFSGTTPSRPPRRRDRRGSRRRRPVPRLRSRPRRRRARRGWRRRRRAFAGRAVRAAVVTARVRAAVRHAFPCGCRLGGDVVVVDAHGHSPRLAAVQRRRRLRERMRLTNGVAESIIQPTGCTTERFHRWTR